jgi:hypothetical protein
MGDWAIPGHRVELLSYHTHVLAYMGSGEWKFSTVDEYEDRMTRALSMSRAGSMALD